MGLIKVISTSVIKSGTSNGGRAWTLREVVAVKAEDDSPIQTTLKSFDGFTNGEVVDVEFEKQEHEKYGVSYMLKRKDGKGGDAGGGADTGLIAEQVQALQTRVTALEARVDTLSPTGSAQLGASDVPGGFEAPAPAPVGGDDDIPF